MAHRAQRRGKASYLPPVLCFCSDVWLPGAPEQSLWQERVILNMVDRLGYHLCEKLFWYSPSKMPSPAEWVTVRRVRVTPAVETIWWLSKTPNPHANNRNVLTKYSESMKRALEKGTNVGVRPSVTSSRKEHSARIMAGPSRIIS